MVWCIRARLGKDEGDTQPHVSGLQQRERDGERYRYHWCLLGSKEFEKPPTKSQGTMDVETDRNVGPLLTVAQSLILRHLHHTNARVPNTKKHCQKRFVHCTRLAQGLWQQHQRIVIDQDLGSPMIYHPISCMIQLSNNYNNYTPTCQNLGQAQRSKARAKSPRV